jgi:catechol 2,3-dioxygenase-like lactoylglutathione lyase family enzyme
MKTANQPSEAEMTRPYLTGIHHLKVPVTDLKASLTWWELAFGAERLPKLDHTAPDDKVFGYILRVPGLEEPIELRLDPEAAKAMTRLDPITFAVDTLADLAALEALCEQAGLRHSPVLRGLIGWLLVLATPDDLYLRIHTRETHEWDLANADLHSAWISPPR